MLSGVSSFTSSIGHSKKSAFQQCIPMIIAILLAIEFLIIVVIIAFYDKSKNSDNYFYISTVSYFIFSTIYFAWHSIVKENAFELLSFTMITTILNSIAIYLAFRHDVIDGIKYSCITFFALVQVLYYVLCYISYRHFKISAHNLNESVHVRKIMAIRTFEMFISMIKVDFMLYAVIFATYIYYSMTLWNDFKIGGVTIGAFLGFFLVFHSILGIYAVLFI